MIRLKCTPSEIVIVEISSPPPSVASKLWLRLEFDFGKAGNLIRTLLVVPVGGFYTIDFLLVCFLLLDGDGQAVDPEVGADAVYDQEGPSEVDD